MDIWIIEEVTEEHDDCAEVSPKVSRRYLDYGYFTDQDDAEGVAHTLTEMSGQGYPDVPYDPTGCNAVGRFTISYCEATKVSPVPEDLSL